MVTNLKHELRTPLNHIIGYSEMLLEEAEDQSQVRFVAELEHIHLAGRQLLAVINDLFDPIKSSSYKGNAELLQHRFRTPLNQIIGYAEMLQDEAREQGALDFAADAGKIISAARRLLDLILGCVIEANEGTTESPAIPDAPTATLLRRVDDAGISDQHSAESDPGDSILIVDDDEDNRAMLARRLLRLGYQIAVAESGRRALELLHSERFDLILLDIQMPEMDGYEVLDHLRADPSLAGIPVIALSASDEIERVAQSLEMGAEDYLAKPFDPKLLQTRISASLERKRLRDREIRYLHEIEREKQRSDDLLHIVLPHDVAEELKATHVVKPRRFENVGVLFCDIAGFTAWCEKHPPEEVLAHLQSLVTEFERISGEFALEKIKTIGDAYMATAGLFRRSPNPVLDCIRCGLAMIARSRKLPPHWKVRIGVQAGPVIAGVVGNRKYQYDIWGDTVNTAARMQAAAQPESVCVTARTWELVAQNCNARRHGKIHIKGKGEQDLYCITSLR